MQLLFFLCFLHLRNKFMLIMDTNNSPIHTFPSEWVSPKTNLHRISLHASSDCTKTPSSRAFTSHASNCNCRQSQNKTGKKKQKKQVNPCQSVLPSSWWLICHFFSGKVLYCMINRAYTCKSVCKCACVCVRAVFHWHMRPHLCRPASQIPQSSKHTNLPHQSISQIVATKIIVLDVSNDNQRIYVLQFFLTHQDSPQMHSKGFTSGKCSAWPWRIAVSIMKPGAFYHKLKQPDWLITETVITFAVSMQARKPFGFHMCDLPFIHSHT